MAADIFGEAVDRRSAPCASGLAQSGPRKVLSIAIGGLSPSPNAASRAARNRLDVDQLIGRVGRAFEIDEADAALLLALGDGRVDLLARRARREIDPGHAELAEDLGDHRLGRRIERARMDDAVAGPDEGQQQRRDRRHAAGEGERVVGVFPDREPILQDLLVRPVEARVDEAFGAAGPLAGHAFEEALTRCRILEHEGRGQEDRRLQRAFAELRDRSHNRASASGRSACDCRCWSARAAAARWLEMAAAISSSVGNSILLVRARP